MDIHTAAHYIKSGYRVRRSSWGARFNFRWVDKYRVVGFPFHLADLLADDWEIDFTDLIDDSGAEVLYKEPRSDEEE